MSFVCSLRGQNTYKNMKKQGLTLLSTYTLHIYNATLKGIGYAFQISTVRSNTLAVLILSNYNHNCILIDSSLGQCSKKKLQDCP